jgi:orotidine-5'-phosphate decarboxylase
MQPHEKITFALDVSTGQKAAELIDKLSPYVGAFKLGLELFVGTGGYFNWPHQLIELTDRPIILDLKLHDIPETVARAVKTAGDLGYKMLTIHVQQRKTVEMALAAAEPFGIKLLGVTVLTSMDRQDCIDLDYATVEPSARALYLAVKAHNFGLRGFVCSPTEVARIKTRLPDAFCLVPGIRPAGANADDQKRMGTPAQAVADGADLIVVGRPIRDAADQVAAAQAIAKEIPNG